MSAPELVPGYVVGGKYAIRSRLLQAGAMASYRALGPKNRDVVVKLYDPAILSFPDVLKTLASHRSIGAKLPPQQILPIIEAGTDANSGAPYTVTDFESGPSLAQLIDRAPLPGPAMVTVVRNLARTIDLLHSSGIVGLSLHPSNVFVRPAAQYEVRVADFGGSLIRKTLLAPEKTGRWMPWLAPEQIKGQPPPTQTADIFALGLIAFFAVTGKPYWRTGQGKTPDLGALRREILGERMPASVRASEFSITLNPAVDAIFARALSFRATDRYATAAEFAAGLDAALSSPLGAEAVIAGSPAVNVASALTGPDAHRAPSPAEATPGTQRMAAPAPRKMPHRATMLGMGNPAPEKPKTPAAAGTRPLSTTMLGIPGRAVEARTAVPVKAVAPPLYAEPPMVLPPQTTAQRGGPPSLPMAAPRQPMATPPLPMVAPRAPMPTPPLPMVAPRQTMATPPLPVAAPPLPMAPPPAQMEEVLARFEAAAPEPSPAAAVPPPTTGGDVGLASPAPPSALPSDSAAESVQTGVAVIGAHVSDSPRNSRVRWMASAGALLVLVGGAAWALTGGNSSGPRSGAASDTKTLATATTPAPLEPPAPPPAPPIEAPQLAEPVAPAPPPTAAEPVLPDDTNAAPATAIAPEESAPGPTSAPDPPPPTAAPATAPASPSNKPCGKFLKRCK